MIQDLNWEDDEIIKECISQAKFHSEKAKGWREKFRQAQLRQDEYEALAAEKYEEAARLEQAAAKD